MKRTVPILFILLISACTGAVSIFAAAPPPGTASTETISEIRIDIVGIQNKKMRTNFIRMARALIPISPPAPFDSKAVQQSLDFLALSQRFSSINVDVTEDTGRLTLIYRLTPNPLIRSIQIKGYDPLFQREVRNALTIYVGDIFQKDDIDTQKTAIRELYRREGFPEAEAIVEVKHDDSELYVDITVIVQKGFHYTVIDVDVRGNEIYTDVRLKPKIQYWYAGPFSFSAPRYVERQTQKDVKSLKRFYRKRNFPEAEITVELEKDETTKTVVVIYHVREGPRYKVEFTGNTEFNDHTLMSEVGLFKESSISGVPAAVRKSAVDIRKRYREAGYLNVRVTHNISGEIEKNHRVRIVTFSIEAGHKSVVSSVNIRGNRFFTTQKLMKQMLIRPKGSFSGGAYNPDVLEKDLSAIRTLYTQEGFTHPDIQKEITFSENKTRVDVVLRISEGVRSVVKKIRISPPDIVSWEALHNDLALKPGRPYREYMIESDENTISARISEMGHPHVSVTGDAAFSNNKRRVDIHYRLEPGPFVRMGDVFYIGNFLTRRSVLDRELLLKKGAPFSLQKMLESQRNIRNLGLFESVRFRLIGLKEKAGEITLLVKLEEKKPYYLQTGVGYDTKRGLYTHAKIGTRNIWGLNKSAVIGAEVSEIGWRAESAITEPRLFNKKISTTLGIFGERRTEINQNFGTKTYGATLGFTRKWFERKHLSTNLHFQYKHRRQFRTDDKTIPPEEKEAYEPRSIFVTTPSVSYDTRDSLVRPKKGFYSTVSMDISKGLASNVDDFIKYRVEFRTYYTPYKPLTLAAHTRLGYINPYGDFDNIPDDQAFYLGGTADVRGFDENRLRVDEEGDPKGGRSAASAGVEARIDIGWNLELTIFFDVGRLGDSLDDVYEGETRQTAGAGLRYLTPIGPVGLMYGHKLDRDEGESAGRIHFAVGYTF